MIQGWGNVKCSFTQVKNIFNETFRQWLPPISKSTIECTVKRFEDIGSVKDHPQTERPKTATTEEVSLNILLSAVEDPHCTLRRLAQEHETSRKSVHRVLQTGWAVRGLALNGWTVKGQFLP